MKLFVVCCSCLGDSMMIHKKKALEHNAPRLWRRQRDMLLGARFVENVPLWYKFKPTSPRDADTAVNLFLVVCSVPAVCDSRCCSVTLEGKQLLVVF